MKARQLFKTYVKDTQVCNLVDLIWTKYGEDFEKAWAAKMVHDARPGGLDNHTKHVMHFVNLIIDQYPNIRNSVDKNLVYFSALIHDIGKTMEYVLEGGDSPISYATHLALGIEILTEFKEETIRAFGKDGYYRIMSVIHQHHGEFSEGCHSLESYIVHKADMIEAQFAKLNEDIIKQNYSKGSRLDVEFGKYRVV